ncbi:MAG: GHKL domain-containing protein [Actinobacteria bacterium]|nr:MAG: GHKL domain-containing protein [Actinomycetota bacterium]
MSAEPEGSAAGPGNGGAELDPAALHEQIEQLEARVQLAEERRRALVHIMGDLNESNQKLADQRKAMLHILGDYENDRSRLARQTERLDNSRRALLHILKDSHESNLRLGDSRKAMIHIMGDLRETTQEMERREQELRDKQEQLVQAGKLATLGELTTGVAHELNNPLNNIGLYVGNVIDRIRLGDDETEPLVSDLEKAMEQVRKATEIISHLRTFGRAARVSVELVDVDDVIERSLLLVHEQLRLRGIEVELELCPDELLVLANPIQLEQVFINLLTNARDALADSKRKTIRIASSRDEERIRIAFSDTGPGIPRELEQRIFDPFFTTKEVGMGTGLGLSITYSILREYAGDISVTSRPGNGATFVIELPFADEHPPEEPLL